MVRNDYGCVEVAVFKWGTLTLALAAVTSLALRYVTEPMTCNVPAHFTAAHGAYAQQICFQKQFIHRPFLRSDQQSQGEYEVIQSDEEDVPSPSYTYHQWVPFFLGVAAILCLLPHVIWRMLSGLLWLDAHALLQTIADNQRQQGAGRHVVIHDSALFLQAGLKGGNNMLSLATLGRKVVVGVVCLVQAILMAAVFLPNLSVPGRDGGEEEEEVGANGSIPLPTGVILCDYSVQSAPGRMTRYTMECIMSLAQVYSKGLTFFFYFFFVLFLLSALDVIVWAGRVLVPGLRDVNLQRYVAAISQSETPDSDSSAHFFQSLGLDGRLVLAMTADYCGPLAAADLTNHLWLLCKGTPRPCPASPGTGASGSRGDPGAIPMVTIGDNNGDALAQDGKTEKAC